MTPSPNPHKFTTQSNCAAKPTVTSSKYPKAQQHYDEGEYWWHIDLKWNLRHASTSQRTRIYTAFIEAGLDPGSSSEKHHAISEANTDKALATRLTASDYSQDKLNTLVINTALKMSKQFLNQGPIDQILFLLTLGVSDDQIKSQISLN